MPIEKFINKFYDEDKKFYDIEGLEYPSFKHYKINEVKILLYNNQEDISNDISLLLTTSEQDIPILTNEVIETDIIV